MTSKIMGFITLSMLSANALAVSLECRLVHWDGTKDNVFTYNKTFTNGGDGFLSLKESTKLSDRYSVNYSSSVSNTSDNRIGISLKDNFLGTESQGISYGRTFKEIAQLIYKDGVNEIHATCNLK